MALFGFGKRPRHRTFEYKPRFYDREKEDLEARMSKFRKTDHKSPESIKNRIRGGFKKPISKTYETDEYKQALKRSNKIVFFVAILLVLLVLYFLLEYFPSFMQAFE